MTQPGSAEVRIKLVADDHTSATVEKVRSGLQHVSEEAKTAGEHAGGGSSSLAGGMSMVSGAALAGVAAVGLLVVGLHEGYEAAKLLGEAAVEAANEYTKQVKTMSGVLMLIDAGAHSMKDIKAYAADVHEELELTAVSMGQTASAMDDAFNTLMERGAIGSEHAKELTQDMALVGKVVRGGMEGLASGFSMIEMGVIRARNPIVQLIAATHTLQGNAHQVAAAMQKMTPEEQMRKAEEAISRQAELMKKNGPPVLGLDALKTSFSGVREMFLVSMGKPMLDALLPPLNRVQQFLVAHIEAIQEWGTEVGNKFANVIDAVVAASKGVYDGIVLSWDRVRTSFDAIFGDWAKAWESATGDTASIRASFEGMTEDIILAFELGAKIMKATAEVWMDAADVLAGRNAGTTAARIAGQAVVGATHSDLGPKGGEEFEKTADSYRRLALESGSDKQAVDDFIEHQRALREATMQTADAAFQAANSGHFQDFNAFLQKSVNAHDEGAEKFALSMIRGSAAARQALVDGAITIEGGMDRMLSLDPELAKMIAKLRNPLEGKGITVPHTTNVNISGGIQIKQDFRDADPDRIALVFREDVARKALTRVSAKTGGLLGL